MKIGFDLAQVSSGPLAGCAWYASCLLTALADEAPTRDFLGYRHFAGWFNDPQRLAPLPDRPNVRDPLAGHGLAEAMAAWRNGEAPGAPDLVHSTSFQAPALRGPKLILTIFDLSFWATPQFTTDTIRLACQTGVLDALTRADGLIFISEHARAEFDRFLPAFPRRPEILTAVTPLAARTAATPAQAANRAGDYWLFVGSLEPRKNVEGLLDAYLLYAADQIAPRPLWLAGGNGWRNERIHARLAPLERCGAVRRLGYVPDDQLQQLYRNAYGLIFPSWYEGFGLPVLEAMTLGCPVICSGRTSLPEVGGDAVDYADPADAAALARAMRRWEQDPAHRAALVTRGQARSAHFSWRATAKQTLAFYDRILSAKGT